MCLRRVVVYYLQPPYKFLKIIFRGSIALACSEMLVPRLLLARLSVAVLLAGSKYCMFLLKLFFGLQAISAVEVFGSINMHSLIMY